MSAEIRNGKEYSDACFNCGESKAAIEHYQRMRDPLYCVIISDTEGGMEVEAEFPRHRFVRTLKQKKKEEADWAEYARSMDRMAQHMASDTLEL